ncbi:MAG TPA: PAS domain S-box protein [Vicinamibacterales bacterium]|nr:PAS domain S-box protein [Vicinamibacterales bacterium]
MTVGGVGRGTNIARAWQSGLGSRVEPLFARTAFRYAFGAATVVVALALRILLTPWTGKGAPFVLFFGATLVTSLFAGSGPALCSLLVSLPIAAYLFVVRAGYPAGQAAVQSLLYGIDGLVIVYMTSLINRGRQRTRETIELAPDAYFLADLDARFIDVNQAACRLLGYTRDELVRKTIFDIIPPEDAARLAAVRANLLTPGAVSKGEWTQRRKDGTLVAVEVSSNILPDGRWQAFVRDITERKRTEDERQVFVSLLDNSSDFIGIADPSGKPIYVNPAGRRMVGLAADYPLSRTAIPDYYAPELGSFPTDVILKTMIERGHWSGETLFRNFQTNAAIPVSDTHFLIRDASGRRILGMGTITRDISEARRIAEEREQLLRREQLARREAESAIARLRESEERFRLTIDEAPIGMALVALDGRFVRVNRALCEITAYTSDELTTMTFHDITHPEDLDTDVKLAGQLARGEIPRYQLEKRYIRKDRSIVDVMLSGSVLRGPDGAARYYIAQIEDITERKRADVALRLSEAKFSGIISIADDAIISVDADQRITIFNEGAERIFGYARHDVIGSPIDRLIPERFRGVHRDHFARFAAGEESARRMALRQDVMGLRRNGEEFPAEASISKVVVGGTTFFSVVLRDITYRKSVEQALQRAIAARDEVLGIVAHDLRNPLSVILMEAEGAVRRGPEPERRNQRTRQMILSAADRMNRLIQDLLDVTVVEAGQLNVDRQPIRVDGLVRDACALQTPLASSSGLDIAIDVRPDVHDVWGDRNRLLQVFENLLGNAIKFTPAGGRVTVAAAHRDHEVLFSVTDTGAGIAPESIPHVFDRFWQVAKRAGRSGAGLGLPITRGIVEAHGGRIWVESTIGRGSTFFFTLPQAPQTTA